MMTLQKLSNCFRSNVTIPKHATNTVYVEGLPHDTTEREVARKLISILKLFIDIFRPFMGFKGLRLIPRETKDN